MNRTITVTNNNFTALNIYKGNTLVIDEEVSPQAGDLCMLKYESKEQLVWLLGYDLIGYPIVCGEYIKYPKAVSLPINSYNKSARLEGVVLKG